MLIIRQLFKMYLHNDNIKTFGKKKHTQFYHVYDIIIFFCNVLKGTKVRSIVHADCIALITLIYVMLCNDYFQIPKKR